MTAPTETPKADAVAVLRELEWSAGPQHCPVCGWHKTRGAHAPECRLAAALTPVQPAAPDARVAALEAENARLRDNLAFWKSMARENARMADHYAAKSRANPEPRPVAQDPFGGLHTDPALLAALKAARHHIMTPAEMWDQRVSWCMGMLPAESTVTREDVIRQAEKTYGPRPVADREGT